MDSSRVSDTSNSLFLGIGGNSELHSSPAEYGCMKVNCSETDTHQHKLKWIDRGQLTRQLITTDCVKVIPSVNQFFICANLINITLNTNCSMLKHVRDVSGTQGKFTDNLL